MGSVEVMAGHRMMLLMMEAAPCRIAATSAGGMVGATKHKTVTTSKARMAMATADQIGLRLCRPCRCRDLCNMHFMQSYSQGASGRGNSRDTAMKT